MAAHVAVNAAGLGDVTGDAVESSASSAGWALYVEVKRDCNISFFFLNLNIFDFFSIS